MVKIAAVHLPSESELMPRLIMASWGNATVRYKSEELKFRDVIFAGTNKPIEFSFHHDEKDPMTHNVGYRKKDLEALIPEKFFKLENCTFILSAGRLNNLYC